MQDGEAPYVLSRVWNVQVLPDGRVLLSNGADQTLRVYGPDGRFQMHAGGRGQGPGEFVSMGDVHVRGRELVAYHGAGAFGWERFGLDGTLLESRHPQGLVLPPAARVTGVLEDGTAVINGYPQGERSGPPSPGRLSVHETPVLLMPPDGSRADPVLYAPRVRYVDVGPFQTAQQVGPAIRTT